MVKNVLNTLIWPIATYAGIAMLCAALGKSGFGADSDLLVIARNTVYAWLIALALSYNLTSGRFDFSLGSILILSNIIGCTFAVQWGFGPLQMLALCLVTGAVLGTLSGLAYVTLRLPPIVVSVGVAMVYEGLGFIMNDGTGVKLIGRADLLIFAQPVSLAAIALVTVGVLSVLNLTKFGYDSNSLRGGQAISVSIGVKEKSNAVICYLIGGTLMAVAGLINISILGTTSPKLGLASVSYIMNAFLPLFIGLYLARFSDRTVGILVGSFMQACIISAFAILGLSLSLQSILSSIIVLGFLAFSSSRGRAFAAQMARDKKRLAEQAARPVGAEAS